MFIYYCIDGLYFGFRKWGGNEGRFCFSFCFIKFFFVFFREDTVFVFRVVGAFECLLELFFRVCKFFIIVREGLI